VNSGFRRDVEEICSLLGYYVAYIFNSVPRFRDVITPLTLRNVPEECRSRQDFLRFLGRLSRYKRSQELLTGMFYLSRISNVSLDVRATANGCA
jgi:hypothetical protein